MYGRAESSAGERSKAKVSVAKSDLKCDGVGLAFTPSMCLFERGWGSMTFTINTEPPFDATLTVSEMTERYAALDEIPAINSQYRGPRRGGGGGAASSDVERESDGRPVSSAAVSPRPSPFVQPVSNGTSSYEEIIENVDGVYKTLNHPTPDYMYVSPMVGNCLLLEKLGRSRDDQGTLRKRSPQLAPKLIAVPINPLIPPPYKFAPDFNAWHERELEKDHSPDESMWTFVQCSVASAEAVLSKQGYALLQIDHSFALFGRKVGPPFFGFLGPPSTAYGGAVAAGLLTLDYPESRTKSHEQHRGHGAHHRGQDRITEDRIAPQTQCLCVSVPTS